MKRASLLDPGANRPTGGAETDLTDRLLGNNPAPKPKRSKPNPPLAKRKPTATSKRTAGPGNQPAPQPAKSPKPRPKRAPHNPTARSRKGSGSEEGALQEVIRQAERTIAALESAASTSPARHEISIRVRLDVLAHHLRQVVEYLRGMSAK